ncbi:glutamine amidotransferase (homolog to GMP synthase subunit A) [Natronomonas pharaonis DSM 2160]|uniref:Glutamine amidotransferase (Homolog to GMP synthase subunit A) n=1 Tax=Natronomonas pharaonis (strain ATCC 35678 / DSM 2160 / CIP 103997 / JCM 8858 / NBRC 14720 / NCIMB 2260 / Gabara) TaxID=348780 RepID=A0A1U7EU57_NATPD|nr:type 1 glutamine amidotransferase [Natronomonas pharaonis]CAI48488.1 glutamine amidotransferase (homolog to GMP synthase subunit A) [Natronomonas pharaonis DSM 2160]
MRPRIALLDASHNDPTTPRNFRRELDATVERFSVVDGEFPSTRRFDGLVVSGSRASVYWDEPWITATREWVRNAVADGLSALGICWGHQLLADALGGTVEPMGEYELGYRTVSHGGAGLFDGVPEEFTVFTTHSDAVTELPPGAELIATNDYGVHGFRHGNVYGLQSHPEYDPETAESVVRGKDHLPETRIERVCEEITPAAYERAQPAKRAFDNFLQVVERNRTRPTPQVADD